MSICSSAGSAVKCPILQRGPLVVEKVDGSIMIYLQVKSKHESTAEMMGAIEGRCT